MPKYVIRETKPAAEAEKPVEVWLTLDADGTVVMMIGGQPALYIKPNGTLYRLRHAASPASGLQGDAAGRIKLDE